MTSFIGKKIKTFVAVSTAASQPSGVLELQISSEQIEYYAAYYTLFDLLADCGGLAISLYFVLRIFIPSEFLFYSDLVEKMQTSLLVKSHLNPRFHNMNDSAAEMLTVAKDIFAKRVRVPPASIL